MQSPRKKLLFCASLFLLVVAAFAAEQYDVKVSNVTVWVKAVDSSGQPVEGLKAEDFAVSEDGQRVETTCFEEVKLTSPEAVFTSVSSQKNDAARQKMILFLDLYNVSKAEFLYIRPRLKDFVNSFANKNVEVMLAGVLANRKMGVFAKFTNDIPKLVEVIDKAEGNAYRDTRIEDNEREIRKILFTNKESGISGGGFSGEAGRRTPADVLSDAYKLAGDFSRQDVEITKFSLFAIENFSGFLHHLNEKDHMVVVMISGGFSSDPGRRYFDIVDKAAEDLRQELQDPQLVIYHHGQDFQFQRELQKSIGRLNRLNTTLYCINTRGLIVTDPNAIKENIPRINRDIQAVQEYGDTLDQIARETGGIAFNNSQNFKLGFNSVAQDLSHQYLLCYNAPAHEKSGYHKITVAVTSKNVKIRHREGYMD